VFVYGLRRQPTGWLLNIPSSGSRTGRLTTPWPDLRPVKPVVQILIDVVCLFTGAVFPEQHHQGVSGCYTGVVTETSPSPQKGRSAMADAQRLDPDVENDGVGGVGAAVDDVCETCRTVNPLRCRLRGSCLRRTAKNLGCCLVCNRRGRVVPAECSTCEANALYDELD